jgi:hypothetical protein
VCGDYPHEPVLQLAVLLGETDQDPQGSIRGREHGQAVSPGVTSRATRLWKGFLRAREAIARRRQCVAAAVVAAAGAAAVVTGAGVLDAGVVVAAAFFLALVFTAFSALADL